MKRGMRFVVALMVAVIILAGFTIRVTRDPVKGTGVWFQKFTEGCGSSMVNPCP